VFTTPDKSIAYILSNAGYDVWLGNNRGNKYSSFNTHIKTSENKFWNFTWEEMGTYDVPAGIDYILSLTGKSKLTYIGHS